MFDASIKSRTDSLAEWERDGQVRQEVDDQLRAELGEMYFRDFHRFYFESERRVLRKKEELGVLPRSYSRSNGRAARAAATSPSVLARRSPIRCPLVTIAGSISLPSCPSRSRIRATVETS